MPGPFGRARVVAALKLNDNPPVQLFAPTAIVDQQEFLLFDPTTASVPGEPGVWVHRLLKATRTRDTRRL